jgi:tRNA U34 5-methylaminomethyl-2-thiouridine-forming methyltransferase MnmC
MMDDVEIITTSDGSHTLWNKRLNETYHSVHGAVQESIHVFIKNGLQYFHHTQNAQSIAILEVGFGTGLNALLTCEYANDHGINVGYTTLEPFPLAADVWRKLNYRHSDPRCFTSIHEAQWDTRVQISAGFNIEKRRTSLTDANLEVGYDVIYFDAFAPSVQPELWSQDTLRLVTARLNVCGVFVTYSAKGQLKRDLRDLGLKVETLEGPPGKNEMVRAINLRDDK